MIGDNMTMMIDRMTTITTGMIVPTVISASASSVEIVAFPIARTVANTPDKISGYIIIEITADSHDSKKDFV